MKKSALTLMILIIANAVILSASAKNDYLIYHNRIAQAEEFIAAKSFENALKIYQRLFETYEFVFLRDYQVATVSKE